MLGNLALLTAANVGARLVGFLGLALLARALDVAEFGSVSTALALGTAAFVVTEWGLETIYVRAVARRPSRLDVLLSTFLACRVVTSGVGAMFAFVACSLAKVPMGLGAAVIGAYVLSAFAKSLRAPHIAAGRIVIEATVGTAERLVVFAVIVGCISLLSPGAWVFALAVGVGAVAAVLVSAVLVRPLWRPYGISWRRSRAMLAAATPIGMNALAVWTYYRASLLILSSISGQAAAGLLGAVSVVTMGIGVVSQSMVPVLLPRMARVGIGSRHADRTLIEVLRAVMQLGIVVAGLVLMSSSLIVRYAFGPSYADAAPLLRLLSLHGFFLIVTPVVATILRANGRQSIMLRAALTGAGVSIAAAVVLVPSFGASGAAVATLLGELVVLLLAQAALRDALVSPIWSRLAGPLLSLGLSAVGAALALQHVAFSYLLALGASVIALVGLDVRRLHETLRVLDEGRSS